MGISKRENNATTAIRSMAIVVTPRANLNPPAHHVTMDCSVMGPIPVMGAELAINTPAIPARDRTETGTAGKVVMKLRSYDTLGARNFSMKNEEEAVK